MDEWSGRSAGRAEGGGRVAGWMALAAGGVGGAPQRRAGAARRRGGEAAVPSCEPAGLLTVRLVYFERMISAMSATQFFFFGLT